LGYRILLAAMFYLSVGYPEDAPLEKRDVNQRYDPG
jgi:hypothetical protein